MIRVIKDLWNTLLDNLVYRSIERTTRSNNKIKQILPRGKPS